MTGILLSLCLQKKSMIKSLLSPLDCFYDPDKPLQEAYIAFNLFDFNFFQNKGYDVVYEEIKLESVLEQLKQEISAGEKRVVPLTIKKEKYFINLHDLYAFRISGIGYKKIYSRIINKRTSGLIRIREFLDIKREKKSFAGIKKKIKILAKCASEILINRDSLVEDHISLSNKTVHHRVFYNHIFNFIERKKIKAAFLHIWGNNKDYFDNDYAEYGTRLYKLIAALHYLHFKKYREITISNFSGFIQQAAIIYARTSRCKINIIQHGRYMVHHLPGVLQMNFCKENIVSLWEEEFINVARLNTGTQLIEPVSRLKGLAHKSREKYVLIATSVPMVIDLDIYYQFWKLIGEIIRQSNIPFKVKLHGMDTLTPKFLDFFSIDKISVIKELDAIPEFAIILNSTIYYELNHFSKVFDFKLTTKKESLLSFLEN